jgi:hypothetical protein
VATSGCGTMRRIVLEEEAPGPDEYTPTENLLLPCNKADVARRVTCRANDDRSNAVEIIEADRDEAELLLGSKL